MLALPVAPADTLSTLSGLADEIICLLTPSWFMSVGAHYDQFDQISDDEVTRTMAALAGPKADQPSR